MERTEAELIAAVLKGDAGSFEPLDITPTTDSTFAYEYDFGGNTVAKS